MISWILSHQDFGGPQLEGGVLNPVHQPVSGSLILHTITHWPDFTKEAFAERLSKSWESVGLDHLGTSKNDTLDSQDALYPPLPWPPSQEPNCVWILECEECATA